MGHDFLRHIERCQLLVVLLDMAGVDGRKPQDDHQQLLDELELYNPEILEKKRLVVANKMDLPDAKKNLAAFKRKLSGPPSRPRRRSQRAPVRRVRQARGRRLLPKGVGNWALAGEGLEKLKLELRKALA